MKEEEEKEEEEEEEEEGFQDLYVTWPVLVPLYLTSPTHTHTRYTLTCVSIIEIG